MKEEIHVMPYNDGTKYKNGKMKTKWVVKIKEFFTCDLCHKTYEKGWSDEDADEESLKIHGVSNASSKINESMAIICDDCFNLMREQGLF